MAVLTTYAPLIGGYRNAAGDRLWDKSVRRSGTIDESAVQPFGARVVPLRKQLPEDLLIDQQPSTKKRSDRAAAAAVKEPALRDVDAAFLLDFSAPFLRAVSQVESPSDAVFREKAVFWDLAPARAAYGKILYRQNSFFVNRKQDAGLGTNLNSFW